MSKVILGSRTVLQAALGLLVLFAAAACERSDSDPGLRRYAGIG